MATPEKVGSVKSLPVPTRGKKPERPANVYRLQLPPGGPGTTHIRRQVCDFRIVIERAVLARHREVGPLAAKQIRTACKSLAHALRIDKIIAKAKEPGTEGATLDWPTYLALLDKSIRFEECADRALKSLGLDIKAKSEVERYRDRDPIADDDLGETEADSTPASDQPDAAAGQLGDGEGGGA